MRWSRRQASACALLIGFLVLLAGPAAADVITPAGACTGTGEWTGAGFTESSAEHASGDVIEIPRADTVVWSGAVGDAAVGEEGPRREISGEVQLDLPLGSVTIDDWGGTSVKYANSGDHKYDLPSVLVGVELTLHGAHREDGVEVCSGSVGLVVDGGAFENPLAFAGIGGVVVFGAGMVLAGKAR